MVKLTRNAIEVFKLRYCGCGGVTFCKHSGPYFSNTGPNVCRPHGGLLRYTKC